MAVFRVHKNKDFTVMSNHHLKNKNLSLKAKGLLTLMLSLPEEWDYSVLGLASLSRDGKDAVMSTLNELRKYGYLSMSMSRDNRGHIGGWSYDVFEEPQDENPDTEKPYAENPNTENPPQYNTNIYSTDNIKDLDNEDNNSSRIINNTSNNKLSSRKKVKKDLDLSFVGVEYIDMMERYIAYRKEMHKALTQSSAEAAYRNLLKLSGSDARIADEIIEQSIANGWQGLFELKNNSNNGSNKNYEPQRGFFAQVADQLKAEGRF